MFRLRPGIVKNIKKKRQGIEEAIVEVEGIEQLAVNYIDLTGSLFTGDKVILNTTALNLNLGSGGRHFVFFNYRNTSHDFKRDQGHIMKLRYTPYQLKVFSCEEELSPYHQCFNNFKDLNNLMVLVGELHSMVAPAAAVLKYLCPQVKIAYLMTDGAALPIVFSETVNTLKDLKILDSTITAGHAFGGDLETVNIYTGLIAAKEIAEADIVICAMGPGTVGTGTTYGFTGIEQGEIINAVNTLGGRPIFMLRISFSDRRERHKGISHHSLTCLEKAALTPAVVCLPETDKNKMDYLKSQLAECDIYSKHEVMIKDGGIVEKALNKFNLKVTTMGRMLEEDRMFFEAVGAAAGYAAALLKN